jgi:hypothetical protein
MISVILSCLDLNLSPILPLVNHVTGESNLISLSLFPHLKDEYNYPYLTEQFTLDLSQKAKKRCYRAFLIIKITTLKCVASHRHSVNGRYHYPCYYYYEGMVTTPDMLPVISLSPTVSDYSPPLGSPPFSRMNNILCRQ